MELLLERIYTCASYTIGHLYHIVNSEKKYICDTIEDTDRCLDESMSENDILKRKVYCETAIPTGTYNILMSVQSPKYSNFKKYKWAKKYNGYLPRFEKVKGFSGVLIHVMNTANESCGCVGVGQNKVKGKIINSTDTFNRLMDEYLLPSYHKGEKITLIIKSRY